MTDYNWPKPYILELYQKAISEGCIRVLLAGDEHKFKSLKASFYRIRRRSDVQSVALMRPEYYLCSINWEPDRGTALIIYDKMPDGQGLPEIESVENSQSVPMPLTSAPPPGPTPVEDPAEFDSTDFIAGLLSTVTIEEDEAKPLSKCTCLGMPGTNDCKVHGGTSGGDIN